MPNTEPKVSLKVAVGVVVRGAQVCLSRRRAEQHLAGLWEFPGGKLESGETSQQALRRELFEELGILVNVSEPLQTVGHDYASRRVELQCWLVTDFSGEPAGKEGQEVAWVPIDDCGEYPMPPPNRAILDSLRRRLAIGKAE